MKPERVQEPESLTTDTTKATDSQEPPKQDSAKGKKAEPTEQLKPDRVQKE